MRILYTSDIHASDKHLSSLLAVADRENVDGIIIGGDLLPHRLPGIQRLGILKAQGDYLSNVFIGAISDSMDKRHRSIYLDMGNDDFIANRGLLKAHEGDLFHLLHMEKHPLTEAVDIVGYMTVSPTPFAIKDWEKPDSRYQPTIKGGTVKRRGYVSDSGELKEITLDMETDDTIENDLSLLSERISRPFIFVSHCPPYGTPLDMLFSGEHVGSASIGTFIETWSKEGLLLASFHGHIHESPQRSGAISTIIGDTLSINPGQNSGEGAALRYVLFEVTGGSSPKIRLL